MFGWVLSMVMIVGWSEGSAKLQIGVKKRVENCEVSTWSMAMFWRLIWFAFCWALGHDHCQLYFSRTV